MSNLNVQLIPVQQIVVPPEVVRDRESKVDDDILAKSIREGGIQQPLLVLVQGDHYSLVNGARRLNIALALGISKVPAVVAVLPDGEDASTFTRRLRFALHEHQQDLMPSQRAELVVKLKAMLGLNNQQVAKHLGVDNDSITNWLAILRYVPEIVKVIDAEMLTMKRARVFDGLTEEGQRFLWARHAKELCFGKGDVHKELRAKYPPLQFRALYRQPEKIAASLTRKQGARKAAARPDYSAGEKKKLLGSVEMKQSEVAALRMEASQLLAEIRAAAPIVAAALRNKALLALVPKSMIPELERFAEEYV